MLERFEFFPAETILSLKRKRVIIAPHYPFAVIGECINPSDRRRLAKSLAQGDMSLVRREAGAQVGAGAQVIDVGVSAADVDEERILRLPARTLADTVDVPCPIEPANHKALAAASTVYPGKPFVNPVTGEKASPDAVLPVRKEHACAAITLCVGG